MEAFLWILLFSTVMAWYGFHLIELRMKFATLVQLATLSAGNPEFQRNLDDALKQTLEG